MTKPLDVITIGRAGVDLYGSQVGGRLEDMGSFDKYIGGSPTNMACGTARLGLKSALITRVGDEHMGRFIREQLEREGVDVRGIRTDPDRLTALVILGIRDRDRCRIDDNRGCAYGSASAAVVGLNGTLLMTYDAGANWQSIDLGLTAPSGSSISPISAT